MPSQLCVFLSRLVSRALNSMLSAPDHLLFIYLSSLDHLEIDHGNWKIDFLLVTRFPSFPNKVKQHSHFKELESINGALQIQFEPFPQSYMHK